MEGDFVNELFLVVSGSCEVSLCFPAEPAAALLYVQVLPVAPTSFSTGSRGGSSCQCGLRVDVDVAPSLRYLTRRHGSAGGRLRQPPRV